MIRIVAIAGSLRNKSFNHALLRAASELAGDGASLDIRTIRDIVVYDGDIEAETGIPEPVEQLKTAVAEADGLLIASPEYNNSLPGALKNAIDWMTRPPKDIERVFGDKPVGLIGATPGRGGTRLAQTAWLPVFRTLGMRPWFKKSLYVDGAGKLFDAELRLTDADTRKRLADYLTGFVAFVRAEPR
jgi:NAD(P)H-dependent FMN reductase